MAKEVLLYGSFYSWNTAETVRALDEAKADDLTVRINSAGGDVNEAWTCVAKFSEHKKKKNVKVDGKAYSMAAFFLCYADYAEALDVSEFLLHRAAFAQWYETSDSITEADWNSLKTTNAHLRKALEAKIDVKKFEQMKGVTLDKLFSTEGRIDVLLTAAEALAIGLINKINAITPEAATQINAWVDSYQAKAANVTADLHVKTAAATPITKPKPNNTMNLNELKAAHPALYAELFEQGKAAGVTEERDRVEGLMVFAHIDAKLVAEKIASGKPLSAKETNEMLLKQNSPQALAELKKEAGKNETTTDEPAAGVKSAEALELEKFEAGVDKGIGLKKA